MNNIIKKFLSVVLSLGLILSVIQLPVSAEGEGVYKKIPKYMINFDSLAEGKIGGTKDSYVNGGKEANMWQGFYMKDEINSSAETFYFARGANYNGGAKSNIISRDTADYALEFSAPSDAAYTMQMDYGYENYISPSSQTNSVMHFGFDIKRDDMSAGWSFRIEAPSDYWESHIFVMTADGKVNFVVENNTVTTYNTGTWYNVDIYYEVGTGKWHLYMNDTFVSTVTKKINFTLLDRIRTVCTTPSGTPTKYSIDNLEINEYLYMETLPGDYTDPTIEFTSPSDSVENFVYGTEEYYNIKADVSAYDRVEKVDFYINSALGYTDTKAPYEYSWLVPDSGASYEIKAVVKDSFSKTAEDTAIINVEKITLPTVEITSPPNGAEYEFGIDETVTLTADATSGYGVEKVEFYCDNELIGTDTAAPYEYNWTIPNSGGIHKIKARVTDAYPLNAFSDEISITIIENTNPTVSFAGIGEQNNIYLDKTFDFLVNASDADGAIPKTDIYINNELHESFTAVQKSYSLKFETCGKYTIKAVTNDGRGGTDQKECTVNVLQFKKTTVAENIDFSKYDEGKLFTNSDVISNALGFNGTVGKREIKSHNGNKFLAVGVSETDEGEGDAAYMTADFKVKNAVVEYETDVYFSNDGIGNGVNFRYNSPTGENKGMWALTFDASRNVTLYDGGTKRTIGTYTANTWYRLKIKLDTPNKKYSVNLVNLENSADSCAATDYAFMYNEAYELIHIRIAPSFTKDKPGFVGYDNISMKYSVDFPTVSSVAPVSPGDESLSCVMSEKMGDIGTDDIVVTNEYGEVTVESVEKSGNTIIITPKDGFVSSAKYTITIKSTAPLADGNPIGFDTVATVDTEPKPLDFTGGSFTETPSAIAFSADLVNDTALPKTVTIVTALYKGEALVNVISKEVTFTSSGSIPTDPIIKSASFDNVKAFVINDWSGGVPLSAKVFSFN